MQRCASEVGPETAGREARHQHRGGARPQAGQHRIGLRVGVEQRQVHQVHVVGAQVLVQRVDARAPQRVGMGPQHRLRPRGGARGVLHAARRERVRGAAWRCFGVERVEVCMPLGRVGRGVAVVGGGDGQPAQARAARGHHLGELRLRDAGHRFAVLGEVGQFVAGGTRVGGHRHRAEARAGVPGEQSFGAVVQVDQHTLAAAHAALPQAAGDALDAVVEFAVADGQRRAVEGRPDDEGVVAACQRALLEQPGHVHAGEGVLVGAAQQQGHGRPFSRSDAGGSTPSAHRG